MNCFIDYIGLRGAVSGITPDSGLYVNDLPGINLKSLDAIADSDKVNYQRLWDIIQQRAVKNFGNAIYSILNRRYRIRTLLQSIDLLKQIDAITYDPLAQWRGFTIELSFKNMQRLVASPFQTTHIQELSLYLTSVPAGDVPVKIFDLNTGDVLDSFTIPAASAVIGWNRIKVEKRYVAYRIFCAYDATLIEGTNLYIPQTVITGCMSCVNWIYGFSFCEAYVRGAQTVVKTDPTILGFTNQSYGLSAKFSVGCTYDGLAANNRALFANALWYLIGAEILVERLSSDRINRYTTIDREQAQENLAYMQEQYKINLEQALEGINLTMGDCCIEQNAQVTYREMTTM
jgi:hypothetical protein